MESITDQYIRSDREITLNVLLFKMILMEGQCILMDILSDPVEPPYLGISYGRNSASGPIIPCRFAVLGDS
jgi:hypothetical protein